MPAGLETVGSVVGIGGMFGVIGGMVISPLVGLILDKTGSYVPIFIIAASAYFLALLVMNQKFAAEGLI